MFGELVGGKGYTRRQEKEWMRCLNIDLQKFGIMFERWCEAAQRAGRWRGQWRTERRYSCGDNMRSGAEWQCDARRLQPIHGPSRPMRGGGGRGGSYPRD